MLTRAHRLPDGLRRIARGDVCVPGSTIYDPNTPVFNFKDSTPEHPHPFTSRRFDTLPRRIQLTLPWANSMSYSGHALRHTIGTIVERQAGFEVAKSMLRHKRSSTTDTLAAHRAR